MNKWQLHGKQMEEARLKNTFSRIPLTESCQNTQHQTIWRYVVHMGARLSGNTTKKSKEIITSQVRLELPQ